jgi:ubiquinone biosynthesis protein UbiJ
MLPGPLQAGAGSATVFSRSKKSSTYQKGTGQAVPQQSSARIQQNERTGSENERIEEQNEEIEDMKKEAEELEEELKALESGGGG